MRTIQFSLFTLLAGFLIWKGIYPAFTRIDSDFPNYYTAARLFNEHKDISNIYDDEWFQHQINSYGIEQVGKFSPYPPVTVFLMTPIANVPPIVALRTWTIANIVILAGIIALLTKISGKDWLWCALLVLSSGVGLANNFRLGQFYLILTLLTMSGYYCWKSPRQIASGILFGLGGALKYFPLIFIPVFIARKEWKLTLTCCAIVTAVCGATVLILGTEIHKQYFSLVLMDHISGNIQDPFSSTFQSWNSLLRRLFIFDPTLNPDPLFPSIILFYISKYTIIAGVIIVTIMACRHAGSYFSNYVHEIQFAVVGIAGLLLLPAGATYHFLLLILPIGVLLSFADGIWFFEKKFLLALYAAIGFIPYSLFKQFEGKGVLTLAAYPRLWLITAIFLTTLRLIWKRQNVPQSIISTIDPLPVKG
jgi:hypothetical protein